MPRLSRPSAPRCRLLALSLVLAGVAGPTLPPLPAQAQTILNTERFQVEDVSGYHLGADVSASAQRGNTKLLDLSTSGIAGVLEGRHWTRVIFGGRYLSDDDRSLLDNQYVQLRYSYILSPRTRTFHFVQAQKNESLLLRSRWLVGTGVRRSITRGDHFSLAVGSGLMGEWERLDPERVSPGDPTALDAIRMANVAVVSHDFSSGARLLNILYLQPDLGDPGDMRVLNDLGLAVPVTDRVRTTLSIEWRRDTRPPSTLERDDLTLRMGLGVDFR